VEALLRILHRHWPDVRPGEPLGGGNRNVVIGATVGGVRVVARRTPREHDALAWEIDLLAFLARRGFVVPRPVPTIDGSLFHDGVCVLSWLDGDQPTSDADWRLVATTLQRLHATTLTWPQRPGFGGTREFLDQVKGGDIDLTKMPEDGVTRCRLAWREIADEPRSVVHGDPGAQNLRLSRDGVGILDWDEARVDASVLDLAENPLAAELVRPQARLIAVQTAATAWEAANGWLVEPDYARRKVAALHNAEDS
jgi:Ser/Thr protein kinase RdoA (MazF antagonist)